MTQQENKKIRILQKVLDQCQSKDSDDFCDVSNFRNGNISTTTILGKM